MLPRRREKKEKERKQREEWKQCPDGEDRRLHLKKYIAFKELSISQYVWGRREVKMNNETRKVGRSQNKKEDILEFMEKTRFEAASDNTA
jgi:hypothetical protein